MLINDTRNSSPTSFFCVRMVAIKRSEEKVYNMNSLSKYGLCKVGAYTMASLILLNSFLCPFKVCRFLIISWIGLTISTKLEMNLSYKTNISQK